MLRWGSGSGAVRGRGMRWRERRISHSGRRGAVIVLESPVERNQHKLRRHKGELVSGEAAAGRQGRKEVKDVRAESWGQP